MNTYVEAVGRSVAIGMRSVIALYPIALVVIAVEIGLWASAHLNFLPITPSLTRHVMVSLVGFTVVAAPLIMIEQLWPTRQRPNPKSYVTGLAWWLLAWSAGYTAGLASQRLIAFIGVAPLITVDVSPYRGVVAGALILIATAVFDFFYYWFHRLQHAAPVLWRFHAVHHAIVDLNAVNSYHHWMEEHLRLIPIGLSLATLISFTGAPYVSVVTAFVALWGQFIHTNSRANLGAVRCVLADNHYHRIHHSLLPHHYDRNFAAFFPFWDWIFGTQTLPRDGEFPPTGLATRPNGGSAKDILLGIGDR